MNNKNVILNNTLEQYNKKYINRRHRLVKYTKKQVEDFDKQYGHYGFNNKTYDLGFNHYLLKNRKWALIGDTYYEIPKAPRFTWFRNLNAGVQALSCLVGAGIVGAAASLPFVLANHVNDEASIDESKKNDATISFIKQTEAGSLYRISPKDTGNKEITGIESVFIGTDKLIAENEYTFKQVNIDVELTIKKVAFENHKGGIKVNPKIGLQTKKISITGDQNIEILDKDTEHELTATFKGQTLDDVVYSTDSDAITIDGNKFKVSANSKGGAITIKANKTGYEESEFEIEVASFKYVNCDDPTKIRASQDLKDASSNSVDLVIPSRKFDDKGVPTALTGWYVDYDSYEGAFSYCDALKSVYIPNSFKEVGAISFYQSSSNLATVTFQDGIKYIGGEAFSETSASSFKIPKSVIAFGFSALNPNVTTSIEFEDVSSPLEDDISRSFTPTTNASQNATDFKNLNENSSVNKVYTYTITGTDNIDIDSLEDKYEYSISGTLPDNLKLMTTGNLGNFELDIDNKKVILTLSEEAKTTGGYGSIEVIAPTGEMGYFNISCASFNKLSTDDLKFIGGGNAKAKDTNISGKVVIPAYCVLNSRYDIGFNTIWGFNYEEEGNVGGAFNSCAQITSVVIPETITTVNTQAFQGCTSLSQVTILGNIGRIENNAFEGTSIASFNIQKSVAWIAPEAFKNCNSLNSVTFDNKEGWRIIDGDEIEISEDASINATNLKNCTQGAQDNWGCTGITTW